MNATFIIAQQGAMCALWWLYVSPDDYFACINPTRKSPRLMSDISLRQQRQRRREKLINSHVIRPGHGRELKKKKKSSVLAGWKHERSDKMRSAIAHERYFIQIFHSSYTHKCQSKIFSLTNIFI